MGFRTGSYAKVWDIKPVSDTNTRVRISTSRKNKKTGQYEQDFSGFVSVFGSASAQKASKLKEGSRIKIGDVDVTTKYNKERKITYTNFNMYSFDVVEEENKPSTSAESLIDDGEIDTDRLPY